MISPISIATLGRIGNRTPLSLGTLGRLNIGGTPPPAPTRSTADGFKEYKPSNKTKNNNRLYAEDDEIYTIIQNFLKWQ